MNKLLSAILLSAASILAASVPPGVPTEALVLHLDAADAPSLRLDGDCVEAWRSLVAGGKAAVATSDARPRWIRNETKAVRPMVFFDGQDDALRVSSFDTRAETWTLAVVCAPYTPVKGGGLCSANPVRGHDYDPGFTVDLFQSSTVFDQISVEGAGRIGGQQDQMQRALPCGGLHLVVVVRDATEVRLYVDGALEGTRPVTPATTVMEELRIGARYYAETERAYFHGGIAQLLLYTRALSDQERTRLEEAFHVTPGECAAGEARAVEEAARIKEERQRNRMKPPRVVASWPAVDQFKAEGARELDLAALPVRTDIREALALGVQHMNSLFDRDRDDEPFFYANCMADGTGKMFHSVNIGIPHVVGRCLLACMMAEQAAGIPFPTEGLAILERCCRSSFDNPDNLNSYFDPEKGNARFVEFHNMREGLYGLWALVVGRDSAWAREKGHAMLDTLERVTDEEGRWSIERLEACGMKDRSFGVSVPNATRVVEPLLAWHDATGNSLALKLAEAYARRGLREMFTPEGRFAAMEKSSGHVHSITSSLCGIAAFAARTRDAALLEACCRIMDTGVPEYFSSWGWGDEVFPEHPADEVSRGEMNQTGDVARAALILGDAGYPRYYEMAERYLRGMLLPTQHREAELRLFLKDKELPADDSERDVLARTVGGYAMQHPNDRMKKGDWPLSTLDITSGAVHAMSECWRHRVLAHDNVRTICLLFDCDDERVTVRSGLPFNGRITCDVRKPLDNLRLAMPAWMAPETVHVTVNRNQRPAEISDGCLNLGACSAGDAFIITFAVPCREEKETVDGIEYTTLWAGSQIVRILPRGNVSPLPF